MNERIWDRLLSEQDRAHLAASPRKHVGFGTKPALLLVDLYRWVRRQAGTLAGSNQNMAPELRPRRVECSTEYSETTRRGPRNWHSRYPCRGYGRQRRGGQISEQGKGRPERPGARSPQEK